MSMYGAQVGRELQSVDGRLGMASKVIGGIDYDDPDNRRLVYFLRSEIPMKPLEGEETGRLIPKMAIRVPLWRAQEMWNNREGSIISEEEAQPYLEAQAEALMKDFVPTAIDKQIAAERENAGKIPQESVKIAQLEERLDGQDAKLDAILAALSK